MTDIETIAKKFDLKVIGNNTTFKNLGKLKFAGQGLLTFAESEKYAEEGIANDNVVALIVPPELSALKSDKTLLVADSPRAAFYHIHQYLANDTDFYTETNENIISENADIHPSAVIAGRNVRIGSNTVIGPNVTVYGGSRIGDNVIIQAGAVIGSSGFEFIRHGDSIIRVPHVGGVIIGDDVDIGSCTCIDRGVFRENTVIGRDSKLDNLIHVGHNAKVGERVIIVANCGLGGSVDIKNDVWVGFGVTLKNGITIGEKAYISMGAVVTKDVTPDTQVTGNFAIEHNKFIEFMRTIR